MMYAKVFLVGGLICAAGQLLLLYTNLTSARILVAFVTAGVVLTALGRGHRRGDRLRLPCQRPLHAAHQAMREKRAPPPGPAFFCAPRAGNPLHPAIDGKREFLLY